MGRPKAFDESATLDAAAELFWSQGYDATSISDLEEHLGIGRQSLYNTFGDKHQLFLKAIERYSKRASDTLAATLLAPDAGLAEIQAHFESMIEFTAAEGPRRGCLIANSILELGLEDADVASKCQANQATVIAGLENALGNAKERGEVSKDLDVPGTARMLMAQIYGLSVLSKSGMKRDGIAAAVQEVLGRL